MPGKVGVAATAGAGVAPGGGGAGGAAGGGAAAAPGPPTDGALVGPTVGPGVDDAAPVVSGVVDVVETCGPSVVGGPIAREALHPAAPAADAAAIASATNAPRPALTIVPSWPVGHREGRHLTPRIA